MVSLPVARRLDTKRIAAIDIGSNSIRQLIADVSSDGDIFVIDEMKAAPRLGAKVAKTHALQPDTMDAAIEALGRMALLARQYGAQRTEAVATSAVRDADNAELFLARVKRETGLRVRVLHGDEEARLCFRSALAHFELGSGRAVIMDIGGGSLELAASADGVVEHLASLPLGAIRMTERFLKDGGGPKRVERLRRAVRKALKKELSTRDWRGARMIGSGGTFTNLAGIYLARQGLQEAKTVHGTVVPRVELERLLDSMQEMTPDERAAIPGLNAGRVDIIVAGLAAVAEVMSRIEASEVAVSRYGIREGLLLEAARVMPQAADPGEAREKSVVDLAVRCHYEAPHAQTVRTLALRLFDTIGMRLGCAPDERVLLSDAAMLHDIGYHISYDRHHKHSYHLILHAELLGMSPTDQVIVANVARYHRGKPPSKKHENFRDLDSTIQAKIRRLSALLRVADGFDRGHSRAVSGLKVRWTERAIRIAPIPTRANQPLRLELWGAQRKSRLLARLSKKPVEIVAPDGSVFSSEDA